MSSRKQSASQSYRYTTPPLHVKPSYGVLRDKDLGSSYSAPIRWIPTHKDDKHSSIGCRGRKNFCSPRTGKQAHATTERGGENADECHAPVLGMHVVECNDCAYEQQSSQKNAHDRDESCNLVL